MYIENTIHARKKHSNVFASTINSYFATSCNSKQKRTMFGTISALVVIHKQGERND